MTDPTNARRPRKTGVDKAIAHVDAKIAALRDEIAVLERARLVLVEHTKAGRDAP
jgi:uncharacterized small protein (DUF1192 family)